MRRHHVTRFSFAAVSPLVLVILASAASCTSGDSSRSERKVVDGVLCDVRTFQLKTNRTYTRCDSVEPISAAGGVIPRGSMMRVTPNPSLPGLRPFVLKTSTRFGDVTCRGFFEYDTYFDAQWRLRGCPLNGEHAIDGVPCMGTSVSAWRESRSRTGVDPTVLFHENGRLQQCIAARRFQRDGHAYEQWDVVRLTAEGARADAEL